MKLTLFGFALFYLSCLHCNAQSYQDSVRKWQHDREEQWSADSQSIYHKDYVWQELYKQEFLRDPRSPVKAEDTGYIRFFKIDGMYVRDARIKRTPNAKPFPMGTHSGKPKMYKEYATLTVLTPLMVVDIFPVWMHGKGTKFKLHVYERVTASNDSAEQALLFLPFTDETNGRETYGGGRYLDLKRSTLQAKWTRIDFNRAYNPYCAFGSGFSCPIPPEENKLHFAVRAGEMLWAKQTKD